MPEQVLSPLNSGTFNGPGVPGLQPGRADHYPMVDRLLLDSTLAANPDRILFQTAVNSQRENRTLTFADTNNQYGNRIPDGQRFTYYWLNLYITPAVAAVEEDYLTALYALLKQTVISYKIEPLDPVFILPLWKFFGATQFFAQSLTAPIQFSDALFSAQWKLEKPIVLQQGTIAGLHVALPGGTSPAILDDTFIGFEFDAKREAIV